MRRDVFQAIADPTRREILNMIAHKSLNVNSVAKNFDVSRTAIYKHIKILSEAGMVVMKQQGRERYCEARLGRLSEVSEWVEQYRQFWNAKLDALELYLEQLQANTHTQKLKRKIMAEKNQQTNDPSDREIVISRLINAPRELVFEVWTDPKHIEKWWGPNGFTITVQEMDVRPGGVWKYYMDGLGMHFPNKVVYEEVLKPERLVYKHGSGVPNDPGEFHGTITFEKQGSRTLLTLRALFKSAAERDIVIKEYHAIEAGNQNIDRFEKQLEEILAERQITVSRLLNAPVELVWEVWTKPEHIKNWWGPNGFTNTIFKMDVAEGGEWDFIMHGPDGTDYKNKSFYREIVKYERIVFEHISPHFIATITFTKEDNKTNLNWQMLFDSAEQFEQVVKTFRADEGLKQNITRLEEYLALHKTKMVSQ